MGLNVERGPATDAENLDLLLRGQLDAVITNLEGRYWSLFGPDILNHVILLPAGLRPLVRDPNVIADTYRHTGLYPITDVAVVRPELLVDRPSLAGDVMRACDEANALAPDYRSGIEERLAQLELELRERTRTSPGSARTLSGPSRCSSTRCIGWARSSASFGPKSSLQCRLSGISDSVRLSDQ
jgi:hypothetical protein